ncbi:SRPBCC family protein [Streptomyces sp. NPDC006879]|uniref:SRPBCC family protein n=1 Tax=Streptomyces sp. NPDC006879 TaxID=3364767 RepID=UPI0036989241
MTSQVQESIEVNVPVRAAYQQWTQFETFPQFMEGVERIEQRTDTLTHWVTRIGGVEREFDAEITERVLDERVAWVTVEGQAEQSGVVTFHPLAPGKTEITLRMDFDPEGLTDAVTTTGHGSIDHQVSGDLQRFKRFIEEQGAQSRV